MAVLRICVIPEMIKDSNVDRIFSISVINLRACRAFNNLVSWLRPLTKIRPVTTLMTIPAMIKKSSTFHTPNVRVR